MTLPSYLFTPAAVAVLALSISGSAQAQTPAPGTGVRQAGGIGGGCASCGRCASCGQGHANNACHACGRPLTGGHSHKEPFLVNLCPGACFGYFQTQWRRWDEVCPYPYLGTGVTDAPKPPTPYLTSPYDRPAPKKPDGTLPAPRPIDPRTGMPIPLPPGSGGLPPIPNPGN